MHDGIAVDLIGVHGPDRGVRIPSLGEFFPYQPGDIVETRRRTWTTSNSSVVEKHTRYAILERIEETPEHLSFVTTYFSRTAYHIGQYASYSNGQEIWDFDLTNEVLSPISSAPNELVELGGPLYSPWTGENDQMQMVAKHYRNDLGHYVIESIPGDEGRIFMAVEPADTVGCVSISGGGVIYGHYLIDSQLGVQKRYLENYPEHEHFSTVGAVLGGDTIGTVHDDLFFHVGIDESVPRRSILSPTVASDNVILTLDPPQPTTWSIRSLDGKEIRTGRTQGGTTNVLTVADLAPGVYILQLDEQHPTWHRFIVQH